MSCTFDIPKTKTVYLTEAEAERFKIGFKALINEITPKELSFNKMDIFKFDDGSSVTMKELLNNTGRFWSW